MQWAERTNFGEGTSQLSHAVDVWKAQGKRLLDLTISNPTLCGFDYDAAALLQPLSDPANLRYAAEPFGPMRTREAIANIYYAPKGIDITPERVMLSASTSEAYGYLFRLLCNPGDEVLVPQPSYPLFDLLAQMHDVKLVPYPLQRHDGWSVDMQACKQLVSNRTRAIIVVHPNNPTGHFTSERDREELGRFAGSNKLALVVDEVFLDYAYLHPSESFLKRETPAVTFVLSGLSKVLALPQAKVAWTVVHGPEAMCQEAMRRLEYISDTFLSVSAPVANATPHWLGLAQSIQSQVRARVLRNLELLDELIGREPLLGRLPVEGGWSVVLRVPALESDEATAIRLLQAGEILVHPGSFYGMPPQGFLVLGLLLPEEEFAAGIVCLANCIESLVNSVPTLPTAT